MIVRICILLICLTAPLGAMVNTESLRQGLDTNGVAAEIAFSYSVTQGNSDLVTFGLSPSLVWRTGRHLMFTINRLKTATADGGSLINNGFSHVRYNFEINRSLVYELFMQAQYDESQDLTARYLAGTGLRIRMINRSSMMLAIGVAGMYEYEKLKSGIIDRVGRSSNYISFRGALNDRATVSGTVYFQPRWSDIGNLRILAESGIEAKISGHLSLTTMAGYRYDSEPPRGIKEYDLEVTGGLKVTF